MNTKKRQNHDVKLSMVELIINIGIFAIISVVLMELFLAANSQQLRAKDQGKAITITQSMAETLKAADSFQQGQEQLQLQEAWAECTVGKDGSLQITDIKDEPSAHSIQLYIRHYDQDWNLTKEEDTYCVFVLSGTENIQGRAMEKDELYAYRLNGYASLIRKKDQEPLYHLTVSKYRGTELTAQEQ